MNGLCAMKTFGPKTDVRNLFMLLWLRGFDQLRNIIRGISHYSLSKIEFSSRPSLIGWNTSKLVRFQLLRSMTKRGTGHGLTLARLVFRLRWGPRR